MQFIISNIDPSRATVFAERVWPDVLFIFSDIEEDEDPAGKTEIP